MVDLGYRGGVPTVDPRDDAGAPYQRTTPTALSALGELGTSIAKVGDHFSNIVVDDQFNELQKRGTSLLYGESKPDGTSTPGYTALSGKAALDARPGAEAQFDGWVKEISKNMLGPQQEAFSQRAGAYRNSVFGTIGSHANAQSVSWATNVNSATRANALTAISNAPDDLKTLQASGGDLVLSYQKDAELAGATPGDAVWREADAQGRREALKARVAAIGAKDPSRAMTVLDKNRNIAGADYDTLYGALRVRAASADGKAFAHDEIARQATQAPEMPSAAAPASQYGNPDLPLYQKAVATVPGGMSPAGLARTVQIESGGNPAIANASDHVGLGQFSADTAKAVGITDRTDPEQSIMGIQRYAAQNAQILNNALGRAPTDAELYLAHQQGAGGATKLLQNPDAPAASLIGAKAVIQNGGTQDMTAGQFVSMWEKKFGDMSGSASVPGAYVAPQTPEQRAYLAVDNSTMSDDAKDYARAEIGRQYTQINAQSKATYDAYKDKMGLDILTGNVDSESTILNSPLQDGDKATLLRSYREEQGKTGAARDLITSVSNGSAVSLNPYNTDDQTGVDKAYDLAMQSLTPEQQPVFAGSLIRETGIVPKQVISDTLLKLNSSDPIQVATALSQARAIMDAAPEGLRAAPRSDELTKAALDYTEMVGERGMSAQQAAAQIIKQRDPQYKQKADVLDASWKQAIKDNKVDVNDFLKQPQFQQQGLIPFTTAEPGAGLTPEEQLALSADYSDVLQRSFVDANGDLDLAKTYANHEMGRMYGVSSVSGQAEMMKYPPENFYPTIGGSTDYVRSLAMKDAQSVIQPDEPGAQPPATVTNVRLSPVASTTQDVRAGRPPRYAMFYQTADSPEWKLTPGLFGVDQQDIAKLQTIESQKKAVMSDATHTLAKREKGDPLKYIPGTLNPVELGTKIWEQFNQDPAAKAKVDELDLQRDQILGTSHATPPSMAAETPPGMLPSTPRGR